MKDNEMLRNLINAHHEDDVTIYEVLPDPAGEVIKVIGNENLGYCVFLYGDAGDFYCYPSNTLEEASKAAASIEWKQELSQHRPEDPTYPHHRVA